MRPGKGQIQLTQVHREPWEEIDETQLTLAELCVYRTRRKAVELYLKGETAKEILCATGLKKIAAARLWERCNRVDPETGKSRGFQALVPRSKIKRFIR